jgi:hypothetical protein
MLETIAETLGDVNAALPLRKRAAPRGIPAEWCYVPLFLHV